MVEVLSVPGRTVRWAVVAYWQGRKAAVLSAIEQFTINSISALLQMERSNIMMVMVKRESVRDLSFGNFG
jgi:hypothetical protein